MTALQKAILAVQIWTLEARVEALSILIDIHVDNKWMVQDRAVILSQLDRLRVRLRTGK